MMYEGNAFPFSDRYRDQWKDFGKEQFIMTIGNPVPTVVQKTG